MAQKTRQLLYEQRETVIIIQRGTMAPRGEEVLGNDDKCFWEEHRAEFLYCVRRSGVADCGVRASIFRLEGSGWKFG